MKVTIQRVKQAEVVVEQKSISAINKGILVFAGYQPEDTEESNDFMVKKIVNLRIFEDSFGKMNYSVTDIKGEILLVSQFTLYANLTRGRRPDFANCAEPIKAKKLFNDFYKKLAGTELRVRKGCFGSHMEVFLCNDGPATFIIEN